MKTLCFWICDNLPYIFQLRMKHDPALKLWGEKVVLVPYRPAHVPKYNEWMGDEEMLRLTGSERLNLEQEYEMQQTWQSDQDKCTFIILDRKLYEEEDLNEEKSMVGDTNLFLTVQAEEDAASAGKPAEIEIMIAEKNARRKGFSREALKLMMKYGKEELGITTFIAKIKEDNTSSIKLFESLGYKVTSRSEVFQEIKLVFEDVGSGSST